MLRTTCKIAGTVLKLRDRTVGGRGGGRGGRGCGMAQVCGCIENEADIASISCSSLQGSVPRGHDAVSDELVPVVPFLRTVCSHIHSKYSVGMSNNVTTATPDFHAGLFGQHRSRVLPRRTDCVAL